VSHVQWSRWFPGDPESVGEARRFARAALLGRDGQEAAELIVSEVATNAIRHSASGAPGGFFIVEITGDAEKIRLRVHDLGGPKTPCRIEDADGQEGGRGLFIVDCLI
jgi:serine/threonine-protein kinase RsbW